MKNFSQTLQKWGFHAALLEEPVSDALLDESMQIARVVAVHRESLTLQTGQHEIHGELSGKMLFQADSPLDLPTVGDWVLASLFVQDNLAIVHQILARKSVLKRKVPGKKIEHQLIAANIDVAFIMQAVDSNFNPRRLERYLAMVFEAGIKPTVLLSKTDLISNGDLDSRVSEISMHYPELPVYPISYLNDESTKSVLQLMQAGTTYCLIGSSGVGKTTLINRLLGSDHYQTGEVRQKDNRGKHTTTYRQLVIIENGALLVDTPGMRELGTLAVESGISETFSEIAELTDHCRFHDCSHVHEKGCAILEALKNETISNDRYHNFMKMNKENLFHAMSYQEKRQKDKKTGKLYKSIIKRKKSEKEGFSGS